MHKYSAEEKDFLKNNIQGCSYSKITEMFNSEFNKMLPKSSVMSACFRYGYKNGIDCKLSKGHEPTQFKKGNIPVNKGKKGGYMKANRTSFKKGDLPQNHKPVGSERTTVDGYIEVKIAEPRKWRMKHVVVWEAANGAVPKGHVIIFADSNRQNLDLDNLILISRAKLLIMNNHRLIANNADLTKAGIIIADIHLEIGKKKRRKAT